MPATIRKPEANPMVSALLTAFVFLSGHVIINGQQKKWLINVAAYLIGLVLCCLPGLVVLVLTIMDSYKTAQRLQAGEEIGENEYTEPMLYKICKILDKTATCSRA
jgi:hypothetical protein